MPQETDDDLRERITSDLSEALNRTKDWREEARRAYRFVAGDQYCEEDVAIAADLRKPLIVFNRVGPVVDAVVGMEVGNRHEIRFAPMELSDNKTSELLTEAGTVGSPTC